MSSDKPTVTVIMIGPPGSYKTHMMKLLENNNYDRVNIRGIEWQTSHPLARELLRWLEKPEAFTLEGATSGPTYISEAFLHTTLLNEVGTSEAARVMRKVKAKPTSPPASPTSAPSPPSPTEMTADQLSVLDTILEQLNILSGQLVGISSELRQASWKLASSSSTKPSAATAPSSSSSPTEKAEIPTTALQVGDEVAVEFLPPKDSDPPGQARIKLLRVLTSR